MSFDQKHLENPWTCQKCKWNDNSAREITCRALGRGSASGSADKYPRIYSRIQTDFMICGCNSLATCPHFSYRYFETSSWSPLHQDKKRSAFWWLLMHLKYPRCISINATCKLSCKLDNDPRLHSSINMKLLYTK